MVISTLTIIVNGRKAFTVAKFKEGLIYHWKHLTNWKLGKTTPIFLNYTSLVSSRATCQKLIEDRKKRILELSHC